MPKVTARDVAVRALGRVEHSGAYSQLALAGEADRAALEPAARGLATELLYGTLAWRGRLDAALARFARKPLAKLDPRALDAMRVGAYQLLFLDEVEDGMAVSAAVAQVRTATGPALAGVANAVLRALARARAAGELEDAAFDALGPEAALSAPAWLYARWAARAGAAAARAELLAANERPLLHVRANLLRATTAALADELRAAGAEVTPLRSPEGLALRGLPAPFAHPSFATGHWTAQDDGAQLVSRLLAPAPGARVLDACAGTGGKTLHLAALAGPAATVVAADVSPGKLEVLAREAARLGATNVRTVATDLSVTAAAASPDLRAAAGDALFDAVLLDAPCTGLGTIRRHPEVKWRRTAADVTAAAERQWALLAALASAVRPGGVLVYAVCSPEPEEGPEVVADFLAQNPAWRRSHARDVPGVDWAGLADADGALVTTIATHGCEAFYAARLVAPALEEPR
jgi:16S rRNA (cytosine967-C5)-methyltransferase